MVASLDGAHRPGTDDGWSVKDVLAHIAVWGSERTWLESVSRHHA
jgi:hypothetical protein